MALIIALNAVFAALVVVGMLALLGWGIASDRVAVATLEERRRTATGRRRAAQRLKPAYARGS